MDIIRDVSREQQGPAPREAVLDRAEELGIERSKAEEIIDRMRRDGDVFEPRPGKVAHSDNPPRRFAQEFPYHACQTVIRMSVNIRHTYWHIRIIARVFDKQFGANNFEDVS